MSKKHLDDLEQSLYLNHWEILSEQDSDDISISGYWHIFHSKSKKNIILTFEGLDDVAALPIEKSYACHIKNNKNLNLYFCKNNSVEWKKQLKQFIEKLNVLNGF